MNWFGEWYGQQYFGNWWGEAEAGGETSVVQSTRNLVTGLGSMPKQKNHPHPLFSKITG